MKEALKKILHRFGFKAALPLFIVVALLVFYSGYQVKHSLSWVEHTYQVISQIDRLGGAFERAETSQRGYLLTSWNKFLEIFNESKSNLFKQQNELLRLVSDNPKQTAKAREIAEVIRQRIENLDLQIAEKRSGQFGTGTLDALSQGNDVSTKVRAALHEMQEVEEGLLIERRAAQSTATDQTAFTVFLGILLAIIYSILSEKVVRAERDRTQMQANTLNSIVSNMIESIVVINKDGRITHHNKAATSLLGEEPFKVNNADRAKALGFHTPETKELIKTEDLVLARALKGESIRDLEVLVINKKNPNGLYVNLSGAPIRDLQNEIIGAVAVIHDLTNRKAAEEDLKKARQLALQASKLKSDFLASMSHEIRTPMNGIIGMATVLQDTPLKPEQKENVSIIKKSAEALVSLINGILDISKIEAGKLELNTDFFDVNDIGREAIDLLRVTADEKKLPLSFSSNMEGAHVVYGDGSRLRQVLINLLGNAVKFTDQGSVSLTVKRLGVKNSKGHFRFEVKDTGPGLTTEEKEHIFSVYAQTVDGLKKGGSGLGLSISQELVKMMEGEIGVESTKGLGSIFWFEVLLLESQEEIVKPQAQQNEIRHFSGHVMVVEDQPVNQKVIASLLTKLGLTYVIFNNGQEAVTGAQQKHYDLIFMDCRMPVMDGYKAASLIRASNKSIPIVALSAEGMSGDRRQCLQAGMNDFLGKPINFRELISILEKYLISSKEHIDLARVEQIQKFSEPNDNLLRNLINEYLTMLPSAIEKLTAAGKSKDIKTLSDVAHGLKSSSGSLGMNRVADICQLLEDAKEVPHDFEHQMETLKTEIDHAVVLLKGHASKHSESA
jgi:hypothetical protein